MKRALMLVALLAVASSASSSVVANGGNGQPSWIDYGAVGSMGLLTVGAMPGTPFHAFQASGVLAADGVVPSTGLVVVPAVNDGVAMFVDVGGEMLAVESGDWDWNW